MPRELDHVVRMVRDSHELRQSWVAEDGVVGDGDVCHIEVEILGRYDSSGKSRT